MNPTLNYFTTENFELLTDVSFAWTQTYNYILQLSNLEDWEKNTISTMILQEKVFDV